MAFEAYFNVDMTCKSCVDDITKVIREKVPDVKLLEVNLSEEEVRVISSVPAEKIARILRESGRTANIQGHGAAGYSGEGELGTAVGVFERGDAKGVVRFVQMNPTRCSAHIIVSGVAPGPHNVRVHKFGDISDNDQTVGDIWHPPGLKEDSLKYVGDLGNVIADENGEGELLVERENLRVWDIIGRSVVITDDKDGGKGIGFGIIARSPGIGQNRKKICPCDSPNF